MAFSVTTGVLAQLVGSLLQGADNTVEKLVFEKIESLGRDVISDLIRSTPLGAGIAASKKYMRLIETGSDREFKQSRDQWLNTLKPVKDAGTGSRLSTKILKAFEDIASSDAGRPFSKGNWKWSKSRREWLNEDWKHDWRSQPRDKFGRWIDGRLNYIYVARGRASKKVRSARRRAARKRVKWNAKTGMYE